MREDFPDLLRVTCRVGRKTATEAVHRRTEVVELSVVDDDEAVVEVIGVRDREPFVLAIVIPCSVNAHGLFRKPIRSELDITICDFQFANSFSLN